MLLLRLAKTAGHLGRIGDWLTARLLIEEWKITFTDKSLIFKLLSGFLMWAWLVISFGNWEKWQTVPQIFTWKFKLQCYNILESPSAIQKEVVEGLYNPPDWCLVLGSHIVFIYWISYYYGNMVILLFWVVRSFLYHLPGYQCCDRINFLPYAGITAWTISHYLVNYF